MGKREKRVRANENSKKSSKKFSRIVEGCTFKALGITRAPSAFALFCKDKKLQLLAAASADASSTGQLRRRITSKRTLSKSTGRENIVKRCTQDWSAGQHLEDQNTHMINYVV